MFRGHSTAKVDEKGRASVPAQFREALKSTKSNELCITNYMVEGRYRCLDVYPLSEWLELEKRLRQPVERPPRVISFFQNYYIPGVQECQVDNQGRVLLCARLREYADLGREVVFAGMNGRLRIFNPETWAQVFDLGQGCVVDDPAVVSAVGM